MNRSGSPDAAPVANISYGAPGNVPAAFLLDRVRDSVIVCDSAGRIEYWNARCEELYGWSRGEALGANVHALLGTPRNVADEMESALASGGQWTG